MKALLIATNHEERDFLGFALRQMGLQVGATKDFQVALATPGERPADVIILCAAQEDGLKTVEEIRARVQTPIHLISDSLTESLHCKYLDCGVDCVLQRPVSMPLFIRYTRMLLKRSGSVPASVLSTIEADRIRLDPSARTVIVAGREPKRLTQLEFRLLYVLMTNEGQVMPTEELVERVWGYSGEGNRDLVRGLVSRLRRKIEPESGRTLFIHNLPGIGYRFAIE